MSNLSRLKLTSEYFFAFNLSNKPSTPANAISGEVKVVQAMSGSFAELENGNKAFLTAIYPRKPAT